MEEQREVLQNWLTFAAKAAAQFDRIKTREDREQAARLIAVLNVYQGFPIEQLTEHEIELAIQACIRYGKQLYQLANPDMKPLCVLKREHFPNNGEDEDDLPF